MLKLILRLLARPVLAHSDNQKRCEPPCTLSLREMADMPAFHPRGRD